MSYLRKQEAQEAEELVSQTIGSQTASGAGERDGSLGLGAGLSKHPSDSLPPVTACRLQSCGPR